MDCVAENGDAAVVYVADLRWNKLSIHYASLLTVLEGRVRCPSSLRKMNSPQRDRDTITLACPSPYRRNMARSPIAGATRCL